MIIGIAIFLIILGGLFFWLTARSKTFYVPIEANEEPMESGPEGWTGMANDQRRKYRRVVFWTTCMLLGLVMMTNCTVRNGPKFVTVFIASPTYTASPTMTLTPTATITPTPRETYTPSNTPTPVASATKHATQTAIIINNNVQVVVTRLVTQQVRVTFVVTHVVVITGTYEPTMTATATYTNTPTVEPSYTPTATESQTEQP
jgi:hypothetical protein